MRRPLLLAIVVVCLLPDLGISLQDSKLATMPAQQTEVKAKQSQAPSGSTLEDGTPVKLRLSRTISSADAQLGETVDFEVLEQVKVRDTIIIEKGAVALATVTEAQPKRRMGRGGKLDVNIDSVKLVDGEKAALRAVKNASGGGHVGVMTTSIVATSILFFPAAPLFLLMHGKDITIPKGTEITGYINGNFPLQLEKFQPGAQVETARINSSAATIDISSNPVSGEIELDGSFVGSTPSSVGVSAGEHTLRVSKTGYKSWEKKLKTSSGNVKIIAELEAEAK